MEQGTVLRIEKISKNDGQGLRTVVFLKGCPLRCAWCSTPESQSPKPELFYKQNRCLHCAKCIQSCPAQALSISPDRTAVVRDRTKCTQCFRCVAVCPNKSTGLYGKSMTVEQVMQEVRKETMFYFFSSGGVTLSGGDVLLQAEFARALLMACKEECIHTMAELDMFGAYENIAKIMPYLDGYYVDIKHMDDAAHKKWTGVSNQTILENIQKAATDFPKKPLHVRIPLIPSSNDTAENIQATIAFCTQLPSCKTLEFLPYHRLGTATYGYLGRKYDLEHLLPVDAQAAAQRLAHMLPEGLPFAVKGY